jgi:hypothetical protein
VETASRMGGPRPPYLTVHPHVRAMPQRNVAQARGSVSIQRGVPRRNRLPRTWQLGSTKVAGGTTTPPVFSTCSYAHSNFKHSDSVSARSLPVKIASSKSMTVEKCTAACGGAGYSLAGVEWSIECWCSNAFANNPVQTPDSQCDMPCSGNNAGTYPPEPC